MKRNTALMILSALAYLPIMAQETYESATIATEDLNGTARYVGMGGAMEALGADISTINTNPAGIGLFRRSMISTSFGLSFLPSSNASSAVSSVSSDGKTVLGFDQIGFVFAIDKDSDNPVNFAFNYRKSRNFNEILTAASTLNGASQNKGAYIKGLRGSTNYGGYHVGLNKDDEYIGYDNDKSNYTSRNFSQTDYMLWNAFLVDPYTYDFGYNDASGYSYDRDQKGYIGEYSINISGNCNDRIFWGFTVGLKDVNYNKYSGYMEHIIDAKNKEVGNLFISDEREIKGSGVNLTGGVIIRPIEESPFRFGISISSPTWYELRSSNFTRLTNNTDIGMYDKGKSEETYKYKVFTPWKFGLSLGHTFGQDLAIGASYDYSDYSCTDNRIITDEYYDSWDNTYTSSSTSDKNMNANTKESLKGVSTFKVGFEGKLTPEFAVRAGYNYVTPMYKKNGVRSTCLNADGCYYTSTTDYINWDATNRVTFGLGYSGENFNIDLAYQYSSQNGEFHPFESMSEGTLKNFDTSAKVKNERHQVLLTLGYKF